MGVGIEGYEGLQASRAADYSVGWFKALGRLTMIHGRQSYRRSSFVAHFSYVFHGYLIFRFYKSMLICLIQLYFSYESTFSGSSLFDSYSLTTYNMFFTRYESSFDAYFSVFQFLLLCLTPMFCLILLSISLHSIIVAGKVRYTSFYNL